ncbi:MAG: glycosyltransferase, partial [Candidatus Babeliales bacterium]
NNGDEEGIPNSLKEAMARGMPVISTYHSGIPELVEDGVSGFLVPQRNSLIITKKLEYLINNSHLWHKMGQAGHRKINMKYEKEKVNDRLVNIFEKLMKKIS